MKGKINLLLLISIVVTALPILGLSRGVKTIILFVLGISAILITLSVKRGVKTLKLKLKRIEGQQQGTLVQ